MKREKHFLTPEGAKNIKSHIYRGGDLSILDRFITKKCDYLIEYVPKNIAPNMLTLIGVSIQLQSSLVLYLFDKFTSEAPSYVLFYAILSMFLYQIIDILDGK